MIIVYYFIDSLMPVLLADILLETSKNAMWVTIRMSLFTGVISAFIDNVSTVLIVAPIGLAICKKLKMNPVGMILSISVSSNLQGAATLVGDTTSIMLGNFAGMNFMDFFWMNGKPGIFFAVELGAIATIPIMMILFRNYRDPVPSTDRAEVSDYLPTVMLILMVAALIAASFIPGTPEITNGLICCTLALITIIIDTIRDRNFEDTVTSVKSIDFGTLGLLVGLFIVIAGLTNVGVINDIAGLIVKAGGNTYVATMLPVLAAVTTSLGIEPHLMYFGLLTGATLGGNITPVGASANITAVGLLEKEGYQVSFGDFMRIGVPYTLTAVLVGYLYLWFVWS